jgi:excisionase family DNA binding protein
MTATTYPDVMNVDEVADYLRVAPATVYRLARQGKIPCGKVGRAWRFRKETIDLWISGNPDTLLDLGVELSNAD